MKANPQSNANPGNLHFEWRIRISSSFESVSVRVHPRFYDGSDVDQPITGEEVENRADPDCQQIRDGVIHRKFADEQAHQ
jgi:hypothetical protein